MSTTAKPTCGRCDRPVADQAYVCTACAELLARALGDVAAVTADRRLLRVDAEGDRLNVPVDRPVDATGRPAPLRRGETLGTGVLPWEGSRGDTGGLADELVTSYARQSRSGGGSSGVGKPAERPVPWDDRASAVAARLTAQLSVWVRVVWRSVGEARVEGPRCRAACWHPSCSAVTAHRFPRLEPASMAAWLLHWVEWLRHDEHAVAAVDGIVGAVDNVRRAVDRRGELWYAGRCTAEVEGPEGERWCCLEDLYVRHGAKRVTCRRCDSVWSVEDRRTWLLAEAEDTLATAAEIARAVTALGKPVEPERIRQWKTRGRLVPHSEDDRGRPLYRVGDVLDLLAEDARLVAEREARRASKHRHAG